MNWFRKFIGKERQDAKHAMSFIGLCFSFCGAYYIVWVLWAPTEDFPNWLYYMVMGIVAALMTFGMHYLSSLVGRIARSHRRALRAAVEWILEIRNKVVPYFALLAHESQANLSEEDSEARILESLDDFDDENERRLRRITELIGHD